MAERQAPPLTGAAVILGLAVMLAAVIVVGVPALRDERAAGRPPEPVRTVQSWQVVGQPKPGEDCVMLHRATGKVVHIIPNQVPSHRVLYEGNPEAGPWQAAGAGSDAHAPFTIFSETTGLAVQIAPKIEPPFRVLFDGM